MKLLTVVQFVAVLLASYGAWRSHADYERTRALKPFGGCLPFHDGMTLEAGQCAYIIIPGPPARDPAEENL